MIPVPQRHGQFQLVPLNPNVLLWTSSPAFVTTGPSPDMRLRNISLYLHSSVHCGIIHSGQDVEITHMAVNRQMDRPSVLCP